MSSDPIEVLRRMVEKLAAHVRPTCDELWEETQAALASLSTPKPEGAEAAWRRGLGLAPPRPEASAPVGVEGPLSLLRAGHWREVYVGHRCMRLEVTYEHAAWERLMEQVEAALAQQPAPVAPDRIVLWSRGVEPNWYFVAQKSDRQPIDGMAVYETLDEIVRRGSTEAQQPAAVDEAMVGRFCRRWYEITGRSLERVHVLASLDSALAGQQGGPQE